MWNGDTQAYETVAQFTRDAQLFMVTKQIGDGTAFAILSGQPFEEKAGAILFATYTAALRDIPDISRNLVTASIDVAGLDVDDPGAGRFHATVDPVMARAVTVLYFQIRNGGELPEQADSHRNRLLGTHRRLDLWRHRLGGCRLRWWGRASQPLPGHDDESLNSSSLGCLY